MTEKTSSAGPNLVSQVRGKLQRGGHIKLLKRWASWLFYYPRFTWPVWFYVLNGKARAHHNKHALPLNALQQGAVNELSKNGICELDCAQLFSEQALADYKALGERLINEPHAQQRIAAKKEQMASSAPAMPEDYYISLWEDGVLDLSHPFVQFCLSDEILGIVNGYLGFSARLAYVDLWDHLPMQGSDVASQNWHRDPSDKKIVKVFFYLRDVDETNGPFQYIPGTQERGRFEKRFKRRLPQGVYPRPGAVDQKFSEDQRKKYTGKAGKIIICDTAGLHRGGHVLESERYLFYAYYLTDGSFNLKQFLKNYAYRIKSDDVPIGQAADFAIDIWKENRS